MIFVAVPAALAADCPDCTTSKLCEPHAAADKEAARALREGLANPDPAVRSGAIDLFADACAAHANCRPAVNASMLASAIRDQDSGVRAKAAEKLGAQDSRTVGPILDKEIDPLVKKLDKDPRGVKEEAAWLANYEYLKGICAALGAMGNADAGPAMAKILASTRLKVLDLAAETSAKVKAKEVPPAYIEAIDRVRYSKPSPDRDATWVRLLKGWEAMTKSGTRAPDPSDSSDAVRFVNDCKAWWKANEKTWR
jgi:HEAT repeat protein